MAYEVVYVDGIEDDFIELRLADAKIIAVKEKIEKIAEHPRPLILTERVLDTPLRKIPYGNYRIFLYVNETTNVIYCLAIKHHNKCYKKKQINKVLTILKDIPKN